MKYIASAMLCLSLGLTMTLAQPANFYYSSGRLVQDPKAAQIINSPYLEFTRNGKQQWIAYDPNVSEGRFVSVASSFTGGIACGYVKGKFSFLGKSIQTVGDNYRGVIASVNANKQLLWLYGHESSMAHSTFTSVVKLRDGNVLVSGYEYHESNRHALLYCFDRQGNKLWGKRMAGAEGHHLLINDSDEVRWMTLKQESGQYKSEIYRIDPYHGEILHKIIEDGFVNAVGIRASLAICHTDVGSFVSTRMTDIIAISKYDEHGQSLWQSAIAYASDFNDALELTGVVQRPNGNLQLSLNMTGEAKIEGQPLTPLYDGDTDLLLITLSENGKYIGHEQYGEKLTRVNSIFKSGDHIGIVGSYRSNLWIQDSLLINEKDLDHSYLIYLQDYESSKLMVKTGADSVLLEHMGGLGIYPNPTATGLLTIRKENVESQKSYSIHIYNTSGQLQVTRKIASPTTLLHEEIDVSNLSSGLYHVFLFQDHQPFNSGKLIIRR